MTSSEVLREFALSVPNDTPYLHLEDIDFAYVPENPILSGVSISIAEGEVVSVLGPSGCGKSTLLSIIAGLLSPTSGSLRWRRHETVDRGRRQFAVVFQADTVLPFLSVEDNIAFPLKYLGLSKQERAERVDMLLALGRLTQARTSYPRQLSGGMRRRLALLVGVAPLPHLLLLDEPFGGLDEPTKVGIHGDLLKIVHELGITVLLVTHDLAEAISLGDKVVLLSANPACVRSVTRIDYGHAHDTIRVREREDFHALYKKLWGDMYEGSSGEGNGAPAAVAQRGSA